MLCHDQDIRGGVELWEVGPSTTSTNDSVDSCSSGGSWASGDPRPVLHSALSHPPLSLGEQTPPLQSGLTRSRSFGGLLGSQFRRNGGTLKSGWADQGILGQPSPTTASPRDVRRCLSLHPHVKLPKTPRPERAVVMTGSVTRGLRDTIHATQQDLTTLHLDQRHYQLALSQGRVYEVEKQIKAAERYLKKIEYHLSKLEDLQDQYHHNQRLRDGVKSMAYAYALSPGKDKVSALSNVRSGYRECTETLCTLEVQIEQLIGTLTLEMKGIQGFARLCPGDVFEVVMRHGTQKWKTRGRVGKDNSQTWDNQKITFKSLIADLLVIKAVEVRMLGKTVVIGSKVCETKDLFSPHPQLMTVNLNPSGSLKLNVVITWNPLEGVLEEPLVRTSSLSTSSPSGRRRPILHSFSSSPPLTVSSLPMSKDGLSPECDHDSSFGSMSARSSTTDSTSPMSEYRGIMASQVGLSSRTDSNSPVSDYQGLSRRTDSQDSILFEEPPESSSPSCDVTGNFTLVRKKHNRVEQWAKYSELNVENSPSELMTRSFPHLPTSSSASLQPSMNPSSSMSHSLSKHLDGLGSDSHSTNWTPSQLPDNLPELIICLRNCLEDIQGQFPELHTLEECVLDINVMCDQHQVTRRDSDSSEISLSVESALECFDFLDQVLEGDDDEQPESLNSSSTPQYNEEDEVSLTTPEIKEPEVCVTGSSQLDKLLFIHLRNALLLLQNLGSFGPLKSKEKESLDKLSSEGKLLSSIFTHRNNLDNLRPQHLLTVPHLQVLWDSVASPDEWWVEGKSVVNGLLPVVSSLVTPDQPITPDKVLEEIVCKMTGESTYDEDCTVTAGHFLLHLLPPLQDIVPATVQAINIQAHLLSGDLGRIKLGFTELIDPSISHISSISTLLQIGGEITEVAQDFIDSLQEKQHLLNLLIEKCLLTIQSDASSERAAACCLLGHISSHIIQIKAQINETSSKTPSELSNLFINNNSNENPSNSSRNSVDLSSDSSKKSKDSPRKSLNSSNDTIDNDLTSINASNWPMPIDVLTYIQQNDTSGKVRQAARVALLQLGAEGKAALYSSQLSANGFQGVDVKEKEK